MGDGVEYCGSEYAYLHRFKLFMSALKKFFLPDAFKYLIVVYVFM
jgi:hypothetical protein